MLWLVTADISTKTKLLTSGGKDDEESCGKWKGQEERGGNRAETQAPERSRVGLLGNFGRIDSVDATRRAGAGRRYWRNHRNCERSNGEGDCRRASDDHQHRYQCFERPLHNFCGELHGKYTDPGNLYRNRIGKGI